MWWRLQQAQDPERQERKPRALRVGASLLFILPPSIPPTPSSHRLLTRPPPSVLPAVGGLSANVHLPHPLYSPHFLPQAPPSLLLLQQQLENRQSILQPLSEGRKEMRKECLEKVTLTMNPIPLSCLPTTQANTTWRPPPATFLLLLLPLLLLVVQRQQQHHRPQQSNALHLLPLPICKSSSSSSSGTSNSSTRPCLQPNTNTNILQ